MAKFPIVRTERTIPGRAPSVRADIDVRTGEEAIAQAVTGLGEVGMNLGLKWDLIDAKTQLAESNIKAADATNKYFLELEGNDNPETYSERLNELFGELTTLAPINRRAARVYNLGLARQRLTLGKQTRDAAKKKLTTKAQAADFLLLQKAKDTGDFTAYKASVINGVRLGIYNAKEGERLLDDADKERDKTEKNNTLDLALTQRNEEGVIDIDKANDIINSNKALNIDEKTDLLNQVTTRANQEKLQLKLAIQQKDEEIGIGFLDLLTNKLDPTKPQLTFNMIEDSELSFASKDKWFTKLRTFDNYSEGELKEAFTDKGEVLADIYDKIDKDTLTDELDTMVGRGLSPITAQRIKREIRAPYEKDAEQFFKRIFGWSPELGFENELSSFLYEKTLREWQTEIKKQDATGEKIIEIGRSIARPYFLEHLKAVMPSDTNITRMMELALGEETKEVKPVEPVEVKEEVEEEIKEVPEPKTQVEYDALPSGTVYIDTDGVRKRKR